MKIFNSKTRTILAILFVGIITICSILIAQKIFKHVRIDLTENKVYTLSDGTKNIISKINQPLHIKLYYGRTASMKAPEGIRFFNNYYLYVKDLLEEYVQRSGGKITLEIIDPRPFSEQEDEAIKAGIKNIPITEDENFFFGLSVASEYGKEDVIPFFNPERQAVVEYDISKIITNITTREKKKIGVLSSLAVAGEDLSPYMMQMMQMQGKKPQGPWNLVRQLRQGFDVVEVKPDTDSIAADIDFLMVVHPKDLPEKTLFAIDQYVMKGGKLLVFIDPQCFSDQPEQDPQNPYAAMEYKASSNLSSLLKKWGVEMKDGEFAADRSLAISTAIQQGQRPSPVITFLEIGEDNFNKKEVITSELKTIKMLYSGVLKKVDGSGTTVTPLISTSNRANIWKPESSMDLLYPQPDKMLEKFVDGSESLMLACRIYGKFKTNFPDGIKKEEPKEGAKEPPADKGKQDVIKESAEDSMVIVVADVDMISDMLAYQSSFFGISQSGDNASLALNSFDFLKGTKDLISIRSRGGINKPFEVVDKIEIQAEKDTASEVSAITAKIQEFEQKLKELGTGSPQSQEEAKLVESAAIKERKKIEEEMRDARKELRKVNAGKLENIEKLGQRLQTINMLAAPMVVLLIAIVLALLKYIKAKRYVSRRENQ